VNYINIRGMKLIWLAAFLAITVMVLNPFVISADTPTANITAINETYAWRNVLQTGDFLIVAKYNLTYNNMTSINYTDISATHLFRLMDITNTAQLGLVEAYPYQNKGYGVGVVSFYFPAATAPAWGANYWIRIEGKASAFTSPPTYSKEISASSYSTETVTAKVKTAIGTRILTLADDLGATWVPNVSMTAAAETGMILSTYGEAYFRSAIPGLQMMSPGIFEIGIEDPDYDPEAWNTTAAQSNEDRLKTTGLGSAIQGFADIFSVEYTVISALPVLIASVALIIVGAVNGKLLGGVALIGLLIPAAAWAGWFPPLVMALIAFGCAGYIIFHLVYKGSS
jgi:hypothetical protein